MARKCPVFILKNGFSLFSLPAQHLFLCKKLSRLIYFAAIFKQSENNHAGCTAQSSASVGWRNYPHAGPKKHDETIALRRHSGRK
ncbi:hypothetical protein EB241_14170 [Erwinia psidii]|uniref:Uncharacterized protein n=1 Tax=Erwinia psidii TaxID=69224 RepID=A0A3N6RX52_9GAMM|nr:hypothetical protein EB241_14170 [Erwinia psidii]